MSFGYLVVWLFGYYVLRLLDCQAIPVLGYSVNRFVGGYVMC